MKKEKIWHLYLILTIITSCQYNENKKSQKELFTATDFTDSIFTGGIEGPAVDKEGNLYAVNLKKEGTIGIINKNGKGEIFLNLPKGSIGNGIRFAQNGNMLIADYTRHNILQVNMKTKSVSVYAHDSSMNQPNDIAIMKNEIIFCSDPNWSAGTGKLWMADTNGTLHLFEDSMGTTNGVEVGTGDTVLYVNESVQRNVWAYSLTKDGSISNKRLLIHFNDYGLDGMRCDAEGNLYIARYDKGTVAVISPDGTLIREIKLKGQKPTNITFGGPERKTCFVTLQDRGLIEIFLNDKPGRE